MAVLLAHINLHHGDAPLFSRAALSWPWGARLGGHILGGGGMGIRRKLKVPVGDAERIAKHELLMRDDNDLIDIIVYVLRNDILR